MFASPLTKALRDPRSSGVARSVDGYARRRSSDQRPPNPYTTIRNHFKLPSGRLFFDGAI